MRNEFFYEPERGGGILSWAVRQLALWLVGGLVAYWLVGGLGLFRPSEPAVKPQAQAQPPAQTAEARPVEPEVLGRALPAASNSLSIRARPDGYAYVKADVNGTPMTMAFDTGASLVSLTQADALKAGVAGNLHYTMAFGTANGRGMGAPVVLREVRIGQLVIQEVDAVVMQNLNVSLLGQTFLKRLEGYQMKDGVLTLSWQ